MKFCGERNVNMRKLIRSWGPFLLAGVLPLLLAGGCGGELLDDRNPFYLRGMRLRQEEKYTEAAEAFEKCLRLSPNSAKADLQLAMLCEDKLNDPAGAVVHYRAYLQKAPNAEDAERTKKFLERAERSVLQQLMERYPADVEVMLAKNAGNNTAALTPREYFFSQRLKKLGEENARLKLDLDKLQQGMQPDLPPVGSAEPVSEPVSDPGPEPGTVPGNAGSGQVPPVPAVNPTPAATPGGTSAPTTGPAPAGTRAPIVPVTGGVAKPPKGTGKTTAKPAGGTTKSPVIRSSYKVQKGDTLSSISRTVYGDTRHWAVIRDANPDQLHGSSSVRVGMTLKIPAKPK